MRALIQTADQAKQILLALTQLTGYNPVDEAESITALNHILLAIQANQHHYSALLVTYHQTVHNRRQVIEEGPGSIDQLLTLISRPIIRAYYRGRPADYQRLVVAIHYLRRQGRPACPTDIMHPVFRRKHQTFKQAHHALFERYKRLIDLLDSLLPPKNALFPLGQFIDTYNQLLQLTAQLDQIEVLLTMRYQQQADYHQQLKVRLQAIKRQVRDLRKMNRP